MIDCLYRRRFACLLSLLAVTLCGKTTRADSTVVWVSIDGMRHDYIARIKPPHLLQWQREGEFTEHEHPIFPSLTFPNHIAQVTGVGVDKHGIPMNGFHDSATGQSYSFPSQSTLVRAEPIWVTAKRQGLRVAVIDWPMSQAQVGPNQSDYFTATYDTHRSDADRLDSVINILRNDHAAQPLRLVITYMAELDEAGHRYGPDAPEIGDALLDVDATLANFIDSASKWFDASHKPTDTLYFLVTTDHGMQTVNEVANLQRLIGANLAKGATITTSGPMATIHLDKVPAEQRAEQARAIVAKLKPLPFVSAWLTSEMPATYHFGDPSRVGDVAAVLAPGYSFTSQRFATTQAVGHGPRGMHGYDPDATPNMQGAAVLWQYHHPLPGGGRDLGRVDNTQWHATVAKLLGIEPAADADPRAVPAP